MIDVLSRLIPVGDLAQESKEAIDYWKEYRGQRIRVERVHTYEGEYRGNLQKCRHGIEGKVAKIMTLPPGFVLEDAFEFGDAETLDVDDEVPRSPHDEHDRIFVSFQSVERITFPADSNQDS